MTEKLTCATCKHMGRTYHGSSYDWGGKKHSCGKNAERRRDTIKPSGDAADDFMRNFRSFFDAQAPQKACEYYESRAPLDGEKAAVIKLLQGNKGKGAFGFFSSENGICEEMSGRFVERDEYASFDRKASDGTRDWMLTELGKEEAKRLSVPAINEEIEA